MRIVSNIFRTVESIKKTIKEHEWSIEALQDARSREEVGQKRKKLLSFLTRQINKKANKRWIDGSRADDGVCGLRTKEISTYNL